MLLALVVALCAAAYIGRSHFHQQENQTLDIAVRITILIFGLGSVALRRTRFAAMRLQDITALKGVSELLATLEKTTLQVAFLGSGIAVFGFIATLMTGNDFYAYGAGLVGVVVLLYCYPTRTSWEQALQKFGPAAATPPAPPSFES
jgi:O-antigen/teichoic acid export membrane protein